MMQLINLVVAATVSGAAIPTAVDVGQFNTALAHNQPATVTGIVNAALTAQGDKGGTPASDPLVNALIGRQALSVRKPDVAVIYLDRAPIDRLPLQLRAPTAFDHGRALEQTGERRRAISAYAEAARLADGADRRSAVYAQARLLLADDPSAAAKLIEGVTDVGASDSWEAEMVLAITAALAGDKPRAARLADQSWLHAAAAPPGELAPLQVAAMRASLAAEAGDDAAERAMLLAAHGLTLQPDSDLSARLPVCGDQGIEKNDFVIFSLSSGPYLGRRLIPVVASRGAIVRPFTDALMAAVPIAQAPRQPAGTTFTARCRTVVSSKFASTRAVDPLLSWMTDQGIYPATSPRSFDDSEINKVTERIDALTVRFGTKSPQLIGARWELMTMLIARAARGDPVETGQVVELASAVGEGMRSLGAPQWLSDTASLSMAIARARKAAESDPARGRTYYQEATRYLLSLPFDLGRHLLIADLRQQAEVSAELAQAIVDLDAKAPADLPLRDRQSWALAVANAHRVLGKEALAKTTLARGNFAPDICDLSESPVKLAEQKFSYADYPDELLTGEQEGVSIFDFGLNASGRVVGQRVILSFPANLFDKASLKGLSTVRYEPASRSGKAVACRGVVQPIVWRIGEDDIFDVAPLFDRDRTVPTS